MSATSIATELTRIQTAKADIKTAIEAKGVTVPSDALIDTYDTYIGQISGGGTKTYFVEGVEYDQTVTGSGIFSNQFNSNSNGLKTLIEKVIIPYGYTTIDSSCFQYCTNLTSVTIPNSVTRINNSAFYNVGFTSFTLPSSVTDIGNQILCGCSNLTTITVESGNTTYDSRDNCNAIIETATNTLKQGCKTTIIPNTVTTIGQSAFFNFTNLTNIAIPSSVTTINNYAFERCTSLTSVTVLATTPPTLGNGVFNNNASGRKIYVPAESVETYKTTGNWVNYAADIEAIPSE